MFPTKEAVNVQSDAATPETRKAHLTPSFSMKAVENSPKKLRDNVYKGKKMTPKEIFKPSSEYNLK